MSFAGLSLRDLEYVLAVASEASFNRAAKACAISQPALSIQVQKVEQWLGTPIFERTTRKVIATEAGAAFIAQARRVISEAGHLRSCAPSATSPFGKELRLSAISTLGPYLFPRLIGGLRGCYPDLKFALGEGVTDDLLQDLGEGRLDCTMISSPLSEPTVRTSTLFHEPLLLACPESALAEDSPEATWLTLKADERLMLKSGHCLRHQSLAMCAHDAASQRSGASLETLKYMVAAGEGYTIVPALAARPVENLVYRPLSGDMFVREIILCWRSTDPRGAYFEDLAERIRRCVAGSLSMAVQVAKL